AWEMIPFVPFKPGKAASKAPADATSVTVIGADGKDAGPLTASPIIGKTVVIDRGGFGVRIELEQPRTLQRGQNNTLMVRLIDAPGPAARVGLSYRLVPF